MKPLRWLLLLPLTLATSCATLSGSGDAASWLFVVNAAEATLTGDTLALSEVSPQVIAFTDRPARKFGSISMADLAKAWAEGSDSFASDPPNAILNGTYRDEDGTKRQCSIEVELMAAPVSGSPSGWTWKVVERARWDGCPAPGAPVAFTAVTLLIDPFQDASADSLGSSVFVDQYNQLTPEEMAVVGEKGAPISASDSAVPTDSIGDDELAPQ